MLHTAKNDVDSPLVRHGLTKAALMGTLSGFLRLPSSQVAFPLNAEAWRANQYAGVRRV